MKLDSFQRERLACAYYFAFPGLCYGIFTARLPALRQITGVNDAWIGFLLLAFGGASFFGLLASNAIIGRFGARNVTGYAALFFTVAMTIAGIAVNYWQLLFFCLLGGMGIGFCDVAMNATGVIIERNHKIMCMGFLHASFSLGGFTGALTGSLFAMLALSPFFNFLVALGLYALLWPLAFANMPSAAPTAPSAAKKSGGRLPLFIYACAIMCLLCFVSEGSVGEWGSLLLYSVKNASQQQAALVFAFFCAAMVLGRFCADRLRAAFSDFQIVLCGGILGAVGMTVVLLSPWPWLCLCAYSLMGIGFAPLVPVFFSRAGMVAGLSPERAISAVSLFAYAGLLFFPPFLGILAEAIGLGNALWVIVCACLCIAAGSLLFRQKDWPTR